MEITLQNGRKIGDGHPAYIIAEVGINHNGDINIAKKLIDKAAYHSIDAIKFQKRTLNEMYVAKFLEQPYVKDGSFGRTYGEHKQFLEFTDEQFLELKDYCESKSIQMLVSGFDYSSFDFINNVLDAPIHKVPSPYVTHYPLLERLISYGKPLILSTGMHSFQEVSEAVSFLKSRNAEFALLQCTSMYPIDESQANIRVIETYKKEFNVPVGYSSHDRGIILPVAAVALGASIIEKHFTFDRAAKGPDHSASVEERGLELIHKYIRAVEAGLGDGKKMLYEEEKSMRNKYGVSIVAKRKILKSEIITNEMICFKVPGGGLEPRAEYLVVGKRALFDIETDEIITFDLIEDR